MKKTEKIILIIFIVFGGAAFLFSPFKQLIDVHSVPQVAGQNFSPLPVVAVTRPVKRAEVGEFTTDAAVAYAIDLKSGAVLADINGRVKWPTASLAKLMTAQVVFNVTSVGEEVVIKQEDLKVDAPVMGLEAGEKIAIIDLLRGMLISSANDAANVLASSVAGDQERFAELMNLMAKQFGLDDTHFKNSMGFDDPEQYATARDMASLAQNFLKNKDLAEMAGTKTMEVRSTDGTKRHWLKNSNKLLEDKNIHGVKTGYTDAALGNLILLVEDNAGNKILTVIFGSLQREVDSRALVDWVFDSYDF